jgi:hypothetical protein
MLAFAAANHDSRHFAEREVFDIEERAGAVPARLSACLTNDANGAGFGASDTLGEQPR